MDKSKIYIVFGSTASGKTAYGVELAERLGGEVINADSMQVYRELPILTCQPNEEEKRGITHHLYGYRSALKPYSVAHFLDDVVPAISDVRQRGRVPILVGGTGMYIKSLVEGLPLLPTISAEVEGRVSKLVESTTAQELYEHLLDVDPLTAGGLKVNDRQRVARALKVFMESGESLSELQKGERRLVFAREEYHIIWLNTPRELVYEKINARFHKFMEMGVLWEVANLVNVAQGVRLPRSHGLPELTAFLYGEISMSEAIANSQQVTRNYAKRQITWARHQFVFDEIYS